MQKQIEMEWDYTQDITEYFSMHENLQMKLGPWGVTIEMNDMVNNAVDQMQDSDIFDQKIPRQGK